MMIDTRKSIWCDVDGVVCDYLRALCEFAGVPDYDLTKYDAWEACNFRKEEDFKPILDVFHADGHQERAPLMPGVKPTVINSARTWGCSINFLTARPAWSHPQMVGETRRWLYKKGFEFGQLLFSPYKAGIVQDGVLIDDCLEHVEAVARGGGWGILIDRPYNAARDIDGVIRVENLEQAVKTALYLTGYLRAC